MSTDNYIEFPHKFVICSKAEDLIGKRKYKRCSIHPDGRRELYSFIYHGRNASNDKEYNYTLVNNGVSDRKIRTGLYEDLFEKDSPVIWAGRIEDPELDRLLRERKDRSS